MSVMAVAVGGCASPTEVTTASPTTLPTTTDPATNRMFDDLGVGPYRSRGGVQVGYGPRSVAIDSGLHKAYVATEDPSLPPYPVTVTVLDTRTQTVTASIPVDGVFVHGPQSIAVDPATHLVYLIDAGPSGDLSVIDPMTNTVTARIRTADAFHHSAVAVDSEHHTVYVAADYLQTITAIDTRSNTVVATIPVHGKPAALAVDPGNHHLWVATERNVSEFDPASFALNAMVPLIGDPSGLAIDPETHTAYITDLFGKSAVTFIDTTTYTVGSISLGREASYAAAVDPATHTVFLTSGGFGSITMIDTRTRKVTASRLTVKEPSGGSWTGGIAVDTTTHEVYVENGESSRTIEILTPI
ncbi:YncE family protein [Nocardia sp. NPDC051030]|uniref:YncE family protein n=1 Tax=Nocardia sp. NPDC051030 TaxID=3155162 RepID=UPI00342776A2